jgi:pilus assembly protein Flp/PilA
MLRKLVRRLRRDKRGQALVEYGLLIGGVALISAAAVSLFGHKTSDIIGMVAAILPGAHLNDNGAIQSGHLIATGPSGTSGSIALDIPGILSGSGTDRLGQAVVGPGEGSLNGVGNLIIESQ